MLLRWAPRCVGGREVRCVEALWDYIPHERTAGSRARRAASWGSRLSAQTAGRTVDLYAYSGWSTRGTIPCSQCGRSRAREAVLLLDAMPSNIDACR